MNERDVITFLFKMFDLINKFFEKSTGLFALALSDLLIINVFTTSVGTYNGSCFGVLKVILELNL